MKGKEDSKYLIFSVLHFRYFFSIYEFPLVPVLILFFFKNLLFLNSSPFCCPQSVDTAYFVIKLFQGNF